MILNEHRPYQCLSIAGFDGSGGAGLQADLKTFAALGCYGLTVLTVLPIQNTQGVQRCYEIPLAAIEDQLHALFDDIQPDSIKIGMLFKSEIITLVAGVLKERAPDIPIVLDPILKSSSGHDLLQPEALYTLKHGLLPMCSLLTPNLPEAAVLTHIEDDREAQAQHLLDLGVRAVLIKGGHQTDAYANDLYMDEARQGIWLKGIRINSDNTHGTGCTLSAAIAAYLAQKKSKLEACRLAKQYLSGALEAAQYDKIGHGHGAVRHFYQHSFNQEETFR